MKSVCVCVHPLGYKLHSRDIEPDEAILSVGMALVVKHIVKKPTKKD